MFSRKTGYSAELTNAEYNYTGGVWSYVSDIRLTGGEVPSEGRFEILVGTQWGTVCTYSPPTPGGNSTIQPGRFDKSQLTNNASSPVLMTLEGCSDLNSLDFETHCNVIKGEFIYCNFHEQDALIMCEAIRLVDGPNTYSGRIETSISGQLVTLCDYLFDIKTANVACNMLGYRNGENTFEGTFKNYKFKIIGDLKCKGNESSPFGCAFEHRGYLDVLEYHFTMVNCTKGRPSSPAAELPTAV
ncbi:SRCR1-like protein, partial [Mya arenaria]